MYRENNYLENPQINYGRESERVYETSVKRSLEKLAVGSGDYRSTKECKPMKVTDFPILKT